MILLGLATAAELVESWPLDGAGGLSPGLGNLQWEFGVVTTGPGGGCTGPNAWATQVDADYLNDAGGRLCMPSQDLSGLGRPVLVLMHWYTIDSGDLGWFELGPGPVEPIYGYGADPAGYSGASSGWEPVYVELSGLDDLANFCFVFAADERVKRAGWYIDDIALWDGDPVPPRVGGLTELPDTEVLEGPWSVEVDAIDDLGLESVDLTWSVAGAQEISAAMVDLGDGRWGGQIGGPIPAGSEVTYRVVASDGSNLATSPSTGFLDFRVRLPAPTDLVGPAGRVVDTVATLSWQAPVSVHTLQGYRLWRQPPEGERVLVLETADQEAEVRLVGGERDTYCVTARFDVGEGDCSEPLTLEVSLPTVTALDPDQAWAGDLLRVELTGQYLLLVQDDVDVDLGEGVLVVDVGVVDADRAELLLSVSTSAGTGLRDLTLRTGDVEVELADAFEIFPAAKRPRLLELEPANARQGEALTLVLRSSAAFAAIPEVDLGEGVLVASVVLTAPDTAELEVLINPQAPLGERTISADDGRRVLDGLSFEVKDAVAPPTGVCGTPGAGLLLGLAGLLAARRR